MTKLTNRSAKMLSRITYSVMFLAFFVASWLILHNTIFLISGVIVAAFLILHTVIKLSTVFYQNSKTKYKFDKKYKPFVSIHVACKSEPAELVNQTIHALTRLDYDNYEVIVINSNSLDKSNWIKIKKYINNLNNPDKYKFVHLDSVQGFKAGALNYLVDNHANKKASVIAIVDCDYIVTPDFLSKTVGYFKNEKVGIVQAPQDYHNIDKYNSGLFYEYRSFFRLVMHQAQSFNFVNFTGTMGLIRADLLKGKDMQWSEWCITEDTEAGTRINAMGYEGVFVDKSFGRGLMPFDYNSLARQRQRWVYGNAQILWNDLLFVLSRPGFNLRQKYSFVSQLVTWFHFELLVALMYLIINTFTLIFPNEQLFITTSIILAASLIFGVVGNFIYFLVGLRKDTGVLNRIRAFLAHYGMIYVMSSGWIIFLMGYKLGFYVTQKENYNPRLRLKQILCELSVSILITTTILIKLITGSLLPISIIAIVLFITSEMSGVIYMNRSFIKSNRLENDHENSNLSTALENSSATKIRRNGTGSQSSRGGASKSWSPSDSVRLRGIKDQSKAD